MLPACILLNLGIFFSFFSPKHPCQIYCHNVSNLKSQELNKSKISVVLLDQDWGSCELRWSSTGRWFHHVKMLHSQAASKAQLQEHPLISARILSHQVLDWWGFKCSWSVPELRAAAPCPPTHPQGIIPSILQDRDTPGARDLVQVRRY